jgi:hypothetical protein
VDELTVRVARQRAAENGESCVLDDRFDDTVRGMRRRQGQSEFPEAALDASGSFRHPLIIAPVGRPGLEPGTCGLKVRRAASCASGPAAPASDDPGDRQRTTGRAARRGATGSVGS